MNTTSLAACLFLGVLVTNLLHWRFHKEERCLYFPHQSWEKMLNNSGSIAMIASSVAYILGRIDSSTPALICFSVSGAQHLYSIWIRQTQRRKTA